MNVWKLSKRELKELDQIVKKELRSKQMLGKHASKEIIHLKREDRGRGLKSMRDVHEETRLRVACYMSKSENRWIQAAWRRETSNVENAVVTEARTTMEEVGMGLKFEENAMQLDGEHIRKKVEANVEKGKNSASKGY